MGNLIGKYIDRLLKEAGLDQAEESLKRKVVGKISERLERKLLETVLANMNKTQLAEFGRAMKRGNEFEIEKTMAQITAAIPGISEKIDQVLSEEIEKLLSALR